MAAPATGLTSERENAMQVAADDCYVEGNPSIKANCKCTQTFYYKNGGSTQVPCSTCVLTRFPVGQPPYSTLC